MRRRMRSDGIGGIDPVQSARFACESDAKETLQGCYVLILSDQEEYSCTVSKKDTHPRQ
jgi:hypothetical protein